jgi:hypothetical protein
LRHGAKLILFAALSATLTVAGISVASSGTDSSTSGREQGRHPKQRGIGPPSEVAFDQDVADVMRQVHQAIEKKAPEIAGPIIQKAQDSGDITSDQAGQLRAAAQAIADGRRPDADVRALLGDADVRQVVRDAFREAAKQAPAIGDPIIQKALDENKITSAQAGQLRDQLTHLPPFGPGFGRGPGFGGERRLGRGFPGRIDRDVAAVLGDIHRAVETKESQIADPILTKAVDEGRISQAQADAIRDHRLGRLDSDVAGVLRDIHAAVAKQAPAIGDPIIQKALDAKKITNAQAENIRKKLKNLSSLRGGPPPFGTPGVPHGGLDSHRWDGPDRHGQPRGNAPGAYPNGPAPGALPAKRLPTI